MKTGTVILAAALGVSVLFNLVAFARLRDRDEPKSAASSGTPRLAREERTAPAPPEERGFSTAPAPAVREAESFPGAPAPQKSGSKKSGSDPLTLPSVRNDPQVLGVLEAQEEFGVFWKDLDRIFKARSKFDEAKYVQTVLTATEDFLLLPEASRPAFREAVKSATAGLGNVRRDYDAAKKALPPKDKSNAQAYAVYQQQKDGLDLRYNEQTRAVLDGVKAHMDLKQPRHAELASNLEKYLRNLMPKPTQP